MKARNLIFLIILGCLFCSCNHSTLSDDTWSFSTKAYIYGSYRDTLHYKDTFLHINNGPVNLYEQFDLTGIDTMIQIPDSPWWQKTFYLLDGSVVYPKAIYLPTAENGYICKIDGLTNEHYYILRFVKGRNYEDNRYDWRHVTRTKDAGRLLVDTLNHLDFY